MDYLAKLDDKQMCDYISNRKKSADSIWNIVSDTYSKNINAYKNEPEWLKELPKKRSTVRDNRIFVNTEAVINSIIANPPKPIITPGRDTPESKQLAINQEKFFQDMYMKIGVKAELRKGLRNLYFSRLIVLKPFWNTEKNNFDVKSIDPRKVRFSPKSTKEDNSEFAIEDVNDSKHSIYTRFKKEGEDEASKIFNQNLLKELGARSEQDLLVSGEETNYEEAWCGDYLVCKYGNIILSRGKNPYWDWDGVPITDAEQMEILNKKTSQKRVKEILNKNAMGVETPKEVYSEEDTPADEAQERAAYFYNHFDTPRKPYIFATIFNSENKPIGETDFITQAIPLQIDIDETKRNITENARIVNGIVKIDSTVMDQAEASKLRWETGGIIWGKGVAAGVQRETGAPLPAFVQQNLDDSRKEIDDVMASSSAFRGVREGQETRGGRLALIDQSFLRLNELVQVIDYVNYELFNWFYQLSKVFYTEHHYAKTMGADRAAETLTLMRDDMEDGTEVRVLEGKTLPEDRAFKYEQAQEDLKNGVLSPVDYLQIAGYDSPADKARNLVVWGLNKPIAVGMTEEEVSLISPPSQPEQKEPTISIKFEDLTPDAKVQALQKAGIVADKQIIAATDLRKIKNEDRLNSKKATETSVEKP